MSFKLELYSAINQRITQNADMQTYMGAGFQVDFEDLPPNALSGSTPVLVMRIADRRAQNLRIGSDADKFIREPRLYIDLWHRTSATAPTHVNVIRIMDRLQKLFNGKMAHTDSGSARFYYLEDFPVPVNVIGPHVEPEIKRHAIVFELRTIDGSLIEAVLEP